MTDIAPAGIEPTSWNTSTLLFGKVAAYLWPNVIRWYVSRGQTSHSQFFLLEISAPKVWKSEKKKERKISFCRRLASFCCFFLPFFLSGCYLFLVSYPRKGFDVVKSILSLESRFSGVECDKAAAWKEKEEDGFLVQRWVAPQTSTTINERFFFRGHKNHFWSRWHHC